MRVIAGNLLDIPNGILCHQVNCQRVMGAGLALQIRNRWPIVYDTYRREEPRLSKALLVKVEDGLYVANLYAQWGYGRGLQTNYEALQEALTAICSHSKEMDLPVYIPMGIGCGLAGGDWTIVSAIIERTVPEAVLVRKGG